MRGRTEISGQPRLPPGHCMKGNPGRKEPQGNNVKPEAIFSFLFFSFFFFCLFVFFGPHPRHMEVPRLGVELELSPPAYTTAHSNVGSSTH